MSLESQKVAKKFVDGESGQSSIAQFMNGDQGRRITTDGNVLLSYDWFPIARRLSTGDIVVYNDRYQTGETKKGKPIYSPTTDAHIRDAKYALTSSGYIIDGGAWGQAEIYYKEV